MEFNIQSLDALQEAIPNIISQIGSNKIVLLSGEIGAGKTTLVQGICRHLGVQEKVTSPTFSLVNEYSYLNQSTQKEAYIYHLDLYRLPNEQEAIDIGIEEYLFSGNYCFIEWPDLIEALLPDNVTKINIQILENSTRKVIFL